MKRAEFLNLPKDAQASWVTHSFPDYQMRAYEDSCFFGMFYLIMSCIFQAYELFFKHFHIGVKIDESFFKYIMLYKASNKA